MDVFALTLRLKEEGASAVRAAVGRLGQAAKGSERDLKNLDGASQRLTQSLRGLAAQVGTVFGARAIGQAADTYTRLTNQLRLATGSTDELALAQARVFAIAQRTAQPLSDVGELYGRVGRAAGALGLAQDEVARLTLFVNQAIALSGSSASAASGALVQLGQALAAGTVRAEEFNSIQDGAPALIRAVEQELGLQVGQLRLLATTGKLSSQAFVQAMLANTSVARDFGNTQRTMAQELTRLRNEFVRMVGQLDATYNASGLVRAAIQSLTENLPRLVAAIATATAGWVAYTVAVRSAVVFSSILTSAQSIAAFVRLAKTVRSVADAGALLQAAGGGWLKLASVVIAAGVGYATFEAVSRKLEAATVSANAALDDLVATAGGPLVDVLATNTKAVEDQVAALMQLTTLAPITRTEVGILAREERRLQDALRDTNLTYTQRVEMLERLHAVQAAQAAATVRLTTAERLGGGLPDLSGMIGMTPGGRAIPQIRPVTRNGELIAGGTPGDMIAGAQAALERDAALVRERTASLVDTARLAFADQMATLSQTVATSLRDTFVDGIANGISEAVRTGSFGEGFRALTRSMLSALGSMLIEFGRALIPIGALFAKLRASLTSLNPLAVTAVAAGTIALGAMLRGAAQSAFGGGGGVGAGGTMGLGAGLGSLGVGTMAASAGAVSFAPTTAGRAANTLTPAQPMQVTIIGPNDAGAQRAIATLMDNAARRGLVQGAGIRTL